MTTFLILLPISLVAIIYWLRTKRRTQTHTHQWVEVDRIEVTNQGQDSVGYRVFRSCESCSLCCAFRIMDYYHAKDRVKGTDQEVLIRYIEPKC